MKKTTLIAVACLGIAFSACRESKKNVANTAFQKGDNGILYRFIEDADGEPLKEDEFAAVIYTEKTESDSVITNTLDFDGRLREMFREKSFFKGDLHTALGMMSEGDSAEFRIRLDSTIAKTGRKQLAGIKGDYLIYTVRVKKTIPRGSLTDEEFAKKISTYKDEQNELAKSQEAAKFEAFIASLKTKPSETPSGMMYKIESKGAGITAKPGDTVMINYTAKFLSGKLIETTHAELAKAMRVFSDRHEYKPLDLVVNQKPASGFDEALVTFPEGTKVSLYIPSKLAYKEDGNGGIVKPYTALQCDLEIVAVKHPK